MADQPITRADLDRLREPHHHPDCVHMSGAVPASFPCPCPEMWRLAAMIEELAAQVVMAYHGTGVDTEVTFEQAEGARALLPEDTDNG